MRLLQQLVRPAVDFFFCWGGENFPVCRLLEQARHARELLPGLATPDARHRHRLLAETEGGGEGCGNWFGHRLEVAG